MLGEGIKFLKMPLDSYGHLYEKSGSNFGPNILFVGEASLNLSVSGCGLYVNYVDIMSV